MAATMATRSKSSQRWLKEHFSDPFVKKAQAEGLRSRAAYKLEELVERDRLLRPGMVVVDLGAAPGGWSQWVRQAMLGLYPSEPGRVIALDILEMPTLAGVEFLHGDFREEAVLSRLEAACREAAVPFHDDAGVDDHLQRVLLASDFAYQSFLRDPALLGPELLLAPK